MYCLTCIGESRALGKDELQVFFSCSKAKTTSGDNSVPKFIVGEDIVLNATVKNTMPFVIAYDARYLNWNQDYFLQNVENLEKMFSESVRIQMTKLPNSQDDIVILKPDEEKTHEVYLRHIFPWGLPEQGKWNIRDGRLGQIGQFTLHYRCEIPVVAKKVLNESGYHGNFFEGTMNGQFEFSIIKPPSSSKEKLLEQLETVLNNPPESPTDEYLVRVFLQSYYLFPDEFQNILLRKRKLTLSADKLMACYFGLSMLDTPEARAVLESVKQHQNSNSIDDNKNPIDDQNTNTTKINNTENNIELIVYRTIIFRWIIVIVVFVITIILILFVVMWRKRFKNHHQNESSDSK
jgi:hypothetical protein